MSNTTILRTSLATFSNLCARAAKEAPEPRSKTQAEAAVLLNACIASDPSGAMRKAYQTEQRRLANLLSTTELMTLAEEYQSLSESDPEIDAIEDLRMARLITQTEQSAARLANVMYAVDRQGSSMPMTDVLVTSSTTHPIPTPATEMTVDWFDIADALRPAVHPLPN